MFIKHELAEEAWTPELGGKFSNLKLKIKAALEAAQRKQRSTYMKTDFDERSHEKIVFFDRLKFVEDYNPNILKLIVSWENMVGNDKQPIPFTTEAVEFLENYFDWETGFEGEFDIFDSKSMEKTGRKEHRNYKLSEYISEFASKVENYEKN